MEHIQKESNPRKRENNVYSQFQSKLTFRLGQIFSLTLENISSQPPEARAIGKKLTSLKHTHEKTQRKKRPEKKNTNFVVSNTAIGHSECVAETKLIEKLTP